MDICTLDDTYTLTFPALLRGIAYTQKTVCDTVGIPYEEDDALQTDLAKDIALHIITEYTGSHDIGRETLQDLPITCDGTTFYQYVTAGFARFSLGNDALATRGFPYPELFTPPRPKIRSMGMTDGGRVRVRYTVKRPKEAVRPGNIPNETRMTMANYENELGVVAMRGRVRNPEHVRVANAIIFDPDYTVQPEAVPIGQLDDWLTVRHTTSALKQFDAHTTYLDNIHNVEIYDSSIPGWTKLRKWMKCTDPNLTWYRIKTSTGVNRLFTVDHPLPIQIGEGQLQRIPMIDIIPGMIMLGCRTDRSSGHRRAIPIEVVEHKAVSHDLIPPSGYDLETESDRFDIDTIVTHNCRTTSIP